MDLFIARAEIVRVAGRRDAGDLADLIAEFKQVRRVDAPGFVWRLPVEHAGPIALRYGDRLVVDLSVWRSYADVRQFARTSASPGPNGRRSAHATVLWWVAPGDLPSPEEAVRRLERLERRGPGAAAFTLRSPAPPPSGPARAAPPVGRITTVVGT